MTAPIGRNDRDAQVRAAAVAVGWKSAGGGFLYRVNDAYLFEMAVQPVISGAPVGVIKAKPLVLDPLFWEIVGLPELRKKRVSFRVNGGLTVRSLIAASVALPDEASPDEVVEHLHGHFVEVEKRFQTLLDFEDLIVANADVDGFTRSTLVTWMLAAGRRAQAERVARVGLTADDGGFLFAGGRFEELVLDYLGFDAERGSHVELLNGSRLSIFPGHARSAEQRLRGQLSLMDGEGWFAIALSKLPKDVDRRVRDARGRPDRTSSVPAVPVVSLWSVVSTTLTERSRSCWEIRRVTARRPWSFGAESSPRRCLRMKYLERTRSSGFSSSTAITGLSRVVSQRGQSKPHGILPRKGWVPSLHRRQVARVARP